MGKKLAIIKNYSYKTYTFLIKCIYQTNMLLRIGLIQMNCVKNTIQYNIKKTLEIINESATKNIQM